MSDEATADAERTDAAVGAPGDIGPEASDAPVDADLTSKAAGGFIWALIGLVAIQIGAFATYAVASRVLGPEEIGLVGKLLTVVFWMDVLLDVGMGASVIYEQERGQSDRVKVAFTVNTGLTLAVATGVFVFAPSIAGFFGRSGDVTLFRALALLVLAKGLNQIPDALLRRELDFRRRLATDLVRSVGRFVLAVALLAAGYGAAAMVVGIVASEVAAVALTWFLVRFRPRLRFDRTTSAEMLRYGVPVFGSRLIGMLWLNGDYLVVGAKRPDRDYGNYYTAFRLPELLLGSVYNIFSSVAFPTYSAAREAGPEKLRSATLRSLKLLCLFGFTAGVGMSLIARDFILTVFGPAFEGAIVPMEILCVAGAFAGIGFASGDLFNAVGRPKLGLLFNLIGTPILIGGFLLVVDRGIVAIATVHLIVIVPYSMFRIDVANRLIGTTWAGCLRAMWPAAAAVAGMLATGLPVRLLLPEGATTMLLIILAGALGAVAGLFLGDRGTFGELRDLGTKAVRQVIRR